MYSKLAISLKRKERKPIKNKKLKTQLIFFIFGKLKYKWQTKN